MKNLILFLATFLCFSFIKPQDPKTLEIGTAAPDFSLKGVDGKTYTLKSFAKSKVLMIVFTCNHCPTAQAYESRLKKLVSDYEPKGVQVVAISPNDPLSIRLDELGYSDLSDSYDEMVLRAKDQKFNFPYLYDGETQEVSNKYGPMATPHVFIFDEKRILRYSGRIDDVEDPKKTPKNFNTRNSLDALVANKPLPVEKTKTFGCSIKWAEKVKLTNSEKEAWAKEPVALENIDEEGLKKLLENKTDKLRLINVWATWCGCCVQELPDFMTINRMYRGRDFELITISADKIEKKDKALKVLKEKQASNKNYIFTGDDTYKLIELVDKNWQGALPYTLLVEPNGKIIYQKQGTIDPMKMKTLIVDNPLIGRVY
jgi:peroxiredoxin